jgi:hypothetical protein
MVYCIEVKADRRLKQLRKHELTGNLLLRDFIYLVLNSPHFSLARFKILSVALIELTQFFVVEIERTFSKIVCRRLQTYLIANIANTPIGVSKSWSGYI